MLKGKVIKLKGKNAVVSIEGRMAEVNIELLKNVRKNDIIFCAGGIAVEKAD
jgi:hydrogenase maturation factor